MKVPINYNESKVMHEYKYHSFLYCHDMEDDNHLLCKRSPKYVKTMSQHPLCNIEKVVSAVQFDIGSRMFYTFKNFHKHAHGTCPVEMWGELIRTRSIWCNKGCGISTKTISQSCIEDSWGENVKVAYPGSKTLYDFEYLNISYMQWLEMLLSVGVSDRKRDNDLIFNGITKRITFGWSQKQDIDLPNSHIYENKCKPYASFPNWCGRNVLSIQMKTELGKIMDTCQMHVDMYHENSFLMNDEERNEEFGYVFGKSFWGPCRSRFEFLTIIAEKDSILNRHVDYLNSRDSRYNIGCSYSYLIRRDSDIYRVNFVLCNRIQVDWFMQEINQLK